jgi:teichuronic acid biosynthesis glycosyltransferase TuaG
MPAYNSQSYIAEAIESVLSQTFQNWELIIVNDGSTDSTQTIIDKYVSVDARIKTFYQSNGRQGKARNRAIKEAEGQYLAFLDADDLWETTKLEIQVAQIEAHHVDIVFSQISLLESSNSKKISRIAGINDDIHLCINNALPNFLMSNIIPVCTVMARTSAVLRVGGFSEKHSISAAEDYHLWIKLLGYGFKFYGSAQPLAIYRIVPSSSSSNDRNSSHQVINALKDIASNLDAIPREYINIALKKWMKSALLGMGKIDRNSFLQFIDSNFSYLNFYKTRKVIFISEYIFGRHISIRLAYFILNRCH